MQNTDKVSHAQSLAESLTAQEREFLRCLVSGASQSEIARRLDVRDTQAAALRRSLMKKLGAAVTADAVRIGIYAGQ